MFYIKKLIAPIFLPVAGGLILLLWGLYQLWFTKRKRTGRLLVTLGTAVLLVFGYPGPARRLLRPFEERYAPLDYPTPVVPGRGPVGIVVLGGGYRPDADWPVNSRIDDGFLPRLVEGVRLARLYPDAPLIVSLGAGYTDEERRAFAQEFTRLMALDRTRLLMLGEARDTGEEAEAVKGIAGEGPVALVTSASHLPRAVATFEAAGIAVDPAPCDPWARGPGPGGVRAVYPDAENLRIAQRGAYERIGLLWTRLVGSRRPAKRPPDGSRDPEEP